MKFNQSLSSFMAFLGMLFLLVTLTAFSSPAFYLALSGCLVLLDKAGKCHCLPLAVKCFEFPAAHGSVFAQTSLGQLYWAGGEIAPNIELAKYWLEKAASQGDSTGQEQLAYLYLADNAPDNTKYTKAIKWLEKAAGQGKSDCQWRLSKLYFYGVGGKQDSKQAFEWCLKAAKHGNALAEYDLGQYYAFGTGTRQDIAAAQHWYEKAAKQGLAKAHYQLAICLINAKNAQFDRAIDYLSLAAKHGDAKAQLALGEIYNFGDLKTKKNPPTEEWFSKAAKQGSSVAAYLLELSKSQAKGDGSNRLHLLEAKAQSGEAGAQSALAGLYATGIGKKQDLNQALNWYRKAALQGDSDALTQEVIFYRLGIPGQISNVTEAFEWLKSAAAKGNSEAMVLLAYMYDYGIVKEDRRQAAVLLEKAAVRNNPDAQYQLSIIYNNGIGVTRDEAAAINCLKPAAEQGDVVAQNRLADMLLKSNNGFDQALKWRLSATEQGYLPAIYSLRGGYLLGLGVKQNINKSANILEQVAGEGDTAAKIDLAELLRVGLFGAKKDSKRALALLLEAANDGNVKAQCELADFYRVGDDEVKKDKQEACKWYKTAASQGSATARAKIKKYCSGKGEDQN